MNELSFPTLKNLHLNHQRVFLRADLNIPFTKNSSSLHHIRLQKIKPTIDYILKHKGKVIIATHIGRPSAQQTKNFFDDKLSTKHLLPWFEKNGYEVDYEKDLKKAVFKSKEGFKRILLLENLRFFNGEQIPNDAFAERIAQLADCYVNDAFGLLHRSDTSITLLPQHFPPEKRAFGLIIEKEIKELSTLKENPAQPFVVIIGGNKLKTKLPLIKKLLTHAMMKPSTIVICGTLAYTFLSSLDKKTGKSIVEEKYVEIAKECLQLAEQNNVKISLPVDHVVEINSEKTMCTTQNFPPNGIGVDIGPQTIAAIQVLCSKAKTILVNGTMGKYEESDCAQGTYEVLKAVAKSEGYSIVAGGDTVAGVQQVNVTDDINLVSTGGGATLAFLVSEKPKVELPGLAALL